MKKGTRNIAASIRAKLENEAKETERPFAEVLQYYAMGQQVAKSKERMYPY
jgi:hypothetical protein